MGGLRDSVHAASMGRSMAQRPAQSRPVKLRSQVDRALAVQGVPPRRVCGTEKLDFQPHAIGSPFDGRSRHPGGGLPGRSAGSAPDNGDAPDGSALRFNGELRRSEVPSVKSETVMPGKGAADRRREGALDAMTLARGNDGNPFVPAQACEVPGKIRMRQIIQDKVGLEIRWQVVAGIIQNGGNRIVNGKDLQAKVTPSACTDPPNLALSLSMLLENQQPLDFNGRLPSSRPVRYAFARASAAIHVSVTSDPVSVGPCLWHRARPPKSHSKPSLAGLHNGRSGARMVRAPDHEIRSKLGRDRRKA